MRTNLQNINQQTPNITKQSTENNWRSKMERKCQRLIQKVWNFKSPQATYTITN